MLCLNASFKARLRQYHDSFTADRNFEHTAIGNPKAPPMRIWRKWVVEAWNSLPEELIEASKQRLSEKRTANFPQP
ncbi:pogo transposable element with KRAB domain-like protein [Aphelenchoides avenae]|nr:pogo transposable element with KRAB domain-like protein [Aphelenchus avenae]